MRIIEAIPNISEGRARSEVDAIVSRFTGRRGVWHLDTHVDPIHHRSVITAVARTDAVLEASCALAEKALERIDLTHHRGVHPRIGALDVLPFVPLRHVSRGDAVELARAVGHELARRFELPVFLYGHAASSTPPRRLSDLRRGGLEALQQRLIEGAIVPDFGPRRLHATAGATAVGVRDFLIAYNVALKTSDVGVARAIARTVRESSGGLQGVQALGMALAEQELVQVSMNLVDFHATGLADAFDAVCQHASERGVTIHHSEIVGLIPAEAAFDDMVGRLQLNREPGILEARMAEAGVD